MADPRFLYRLVEFLEEGRMTITRLEDPAQLRQRLMEAERSGRKALGMTVTEVVNGGDEGSMAVGKPVTRRRRPR